MIAPLAVLRFVSLACCHTRDTGAIPARALLSSLTHGFPSDTCAISCRSNPPRNSDAPHDVFNVVLNLRPRHPGSVCQISSIHIINPAR